MYELKGPRVEELREYLMTISKFHSLHNKKHRYNSPESFILNNGKEYSKIHNYDLGKIGKPKQCYANAGTQAVESEYFKTKFRYVEGYAFGSILPVSHAWLIDNNEVVIETTWKSNGDAYFGVEIPMHYLRSITCKNNRWDSVIANYKMRFPLLTEEHTLDFVK